MAILKIARMGHPVLLAKAAPIAAPADLPEIRRLVTDMADTLADAGGVGLAAPQVHVSRRVIIFFVPGDRGETRPLTALVNPEIEPIPGPPVLGWEGCLSIPGLRAAVPRHRAIRWRGLDLDGAPIEGIARDFHARVIQHEVDHLDGVLYPMRMSDFSQMGFIEEMQRFPQPLAGEQRDTSR